MIAELIRLANELDSRGLASEADTIDFLLKNAAAESGEGWTKGQGHHSLSNKDFAALLEADQDNQHPFKLSVERIRSMSSSPPTTEEVEIMRKAKD